MPIALLSDVHGNLPALQAVLDELEGIQHDRIVVTGDLAAGPFPRETLDLLVSLGERARFVRGNADREMIEPPADGMSPMAAWAAERLTEEQRDFLAVLPESLVLEVDGLGPTLFCHGSPRTDEEILTVQTPEARLRDAVSGVRERTVTCGHTHMQFDRTVDGFRVVNPGSIGLPYEGAPGAYWAVLGPDVEFRRTDYDLEHTAALVRAAEYPEADEFVAEYILASTPRAEATEFFEQLARDDPRFAGRR